MRNILKYTFIGVIAPIAIIASLYNVYNNWDAVSFSYMTAYLIGLTVYTIFISGLVLDNDDWLFEAPELISFEHGISNAVLHLLVMPSITLAFSLCQIDGWVTSGLTYFGFILLPTILNIIIGIIDLKEQHYGENDE